jgi:hypothetical protein
LNLSLEQDVTDARKSFWIGVLVFLALAGLGHHTWGTVDAIQRLALTRSLLLHHSVNTEAFGPIKYGIAQSILMLPSYALGYGVGVLSHAPEPHRTGYRTTAFLFSPLLVALTCSVWYRTVRRLGLEPAQACAGTVTLVWCTLLLPYSRLLFSEPFNALLFLLFAAELVRSETGTDWSLVRAYTPLVVLSLNYIVFLPVLGAALSWFALREYQQHGLRRAWRPFATGSLALALTIGAWCWYNYARYGDPLQFGYTGETFTTPLRVGLFGLLLSPGRGILFYSLPTALALVCCGVLALRRATPQPLRILGAWGLGLFLVYLVLYARWGSFEGGWCWGPRFLIPFLPLLHVGLLPFMRTPSVRRLLLGGLVIGFCVNAWEYAIEWQAYERNTFGEGKVDYLRSVAELPYVVGLHGFAGWDSALRMLQFVAIAVGTSLVIRRIVLQGRGGRGSVEGEQVLAPTYGSR